MRIRRQILAAAIVIGVALASAAGAEAACTLVRIDEWPIRWIRGFIVIDGEVNGRKVGIMLDTGASRSFVLRSAAARLELSPRESRAYRMFGIGGESRVDVVQLDEFRIGQAVRKGWHMIAAGEQSLGEGIDVVLGEDFFSRVDVEFDLAHGAVRLFQPIDCAGTSAAYWATDPGVVEIEAISEVDPRIIVSVKVNDHPIRALLDSGAAASVLALRDAAEVGLTPEAPGVSAVGKSSGLGPKSPQAWIGPLKSFEIGNERIRDTTILFADLFKDARYTPRGSRISIRADALQPMLLGADFLRAHRVLVAHSQRKLYFTYEGGLVFSPPRR